MILTTIAVMAFLASCVVTGFAMLRFDRVLKHEHRNHPAQWEADGKPTGYFWMPDETPLRMNPAGGRVATEWLFRQPPQWIESDTVGAELLRSFRLAGRWAITGIITALLLFAVSQLK